MSNSCQYLSQTLTESLREISAFEKSIEKFVRNPSADLQQEISARFDLVEKNIENFSQMYKKEVTHLILHWLGYESIDQLINPTDGIEIDENGMVTVNIGGKNENKYWPSLVKTFNGDVELSDEANSLKNTHIIHGFLTIRDCSNFAAPELQYVRKVLGIDRVDGAEFPKLETSSNSVRISQSGNIIFSSLKDIGHGLQLSRLTPKMLGLFRKFFPVLEKVGSYVNHVSVYVDNEELLQEIENDKQLRRDGVMGMSI